MLRGINHITIAVSNLDKSFDFYVGLLGMKPHVRWAQGAYLSIGETWFCLSIDDVKPSRDYCHMAFDIAESDFFNFAQRVRSQNVVEWKQNKSEGLSLYLSDPDGHKLEIHSGTLESRLESLKTNPYKDLVWL